MFMLRINNEINEVKKRRVNYIKIFLETYNTLLTKQYEVFTKVKNNIEKKLELVSDLHETHFLDEDYECFLEQLEAVPFDDEEQQRQIYFLKEKMKLLKKAITKTGANIKEMPPIICTEFINM